MTRTAQVAAADVVREAREWIGTPYHHQAHRKGVGCDCVGLFVGVGEGLGIGAEYESDYPVTFTGARLREFLERNCELARGYSAESAPVGSILAFTLRADPGPHHVALRTPTGMLHAWRTGVVEWPVRWADRLDSVWWHPEVVR